MAQDNSLPKPPDNKPHFFPEELDPSKKGKEYCLQMCRATYWYNWNVASGLNAFGNARRNDWIENRTWADGNPNMQRFIPKISGLKDERGEAATYLNLDLKPVTLIPKFRDIVINYIEKLEYEVQATAINPEAVDAKEEAKWKLYAAKQLKAWADMKEAEAGAKLFAMPELDFDFNTKEELDVLYGLTQKMRCELEIELGNELVLSESNWRMIKRMLLEDLFDNGACATEVFYDRVTERIRTRYVDICNLIYPPFRGHYLETPERIGYVTTITLAQLKAEAGDELSDQDYMNIAKSYSNKFGNGTFQFPNSFNYQYINTDTPYNYWMNFNIPVITLYWEETDRFKYKREVVDGETYTKPVDYGGMRTINEAFLNTDAGAAYMKRNPNYKQMIGKKTYIEEELGKSKYIANGKTREKYVYASDVHRYYQAKWIPNTEYIYNYGPVDFLGRDPKDPKKALCPIKYVRITNRSLNERLQPFEEANILAWLKLQNAIAKAVPSGYSINITTLKNAMIDGKEFPIKHQIELYEQQGRLIWASENPLDDTGKPHPHPIQAMPSGLINDIQAWLLLMDSNANNMRAVTGVNELMDASTPNPKMLAGTAKIAVNGAQNSISTLTFGVTFLQEMMATHIAEGLRLVVKNGNYKGYATSLGVNVTKSIEVTSEVSPFTYGMKIIALPTEEERMELKMTAQQAVTNTADPVKGGLQYSDYLYIVHLINSGTNLLLVQAIMAQRIRKNLETMQAQAQQNSQAQAEANIQSQQAASQMKLQEKQADAEIEAKLYSHKINEDIRLLEASTALKTENQVQVKTASSQLKKGEKQFESALDR